MKISITIDFATVKKLIAEYVSSQLGEAQADADSVHILVKSKQNYRAEWEEAEIVATTKRSKYIPEVKAEVRL